jgi:hypothetical protein
MADDDVISPHPFQVPRTRKYNLHDWRTVLQTARANQIEVPAHHCENSPRWAVEAFLMGARAIYTAPLASSEWVEQAHTEIDVLMWALHPFLVGAHFIFGSRTCLFLCDDEIPGGDLFTHSQVPKRFSESGTRLSAIGIPNCPASRTRHE